MDSVRKLLIGLIEDRKLTLSDVSRELGRNHAYLQQFIKRGIPQKLPEDVRGRLAEMFGVDEVVLGGPVKTGPKPKTGAPVEAAPSLPEFDLRGGVAYGGGADGTGEWNEDGNAHIIGRAAGKIARM